MGWNEVASGNGQAAENTVQSAWCWVSSRNTPCSLGTQWFPSCILTPHSGLVESTHTHFSLHFFFLGSLAASRPRVDCQCGTHCDKTVLLPFRNDIWCWAGILYAYFNDACIFFYGWNFLCVCAPVFLKKLFTSNYRIKIMLRFGPITSWEIDGETVETESDFIFLGSKITADGDCSHEIKRRLLLGRKVMTNLDSILKSRDITLPTKVLLVKAMVFPVVMYGCESWIVKKAECRKIDAFEL